MVLAKQPTMRVVDVWANRISLGATRIEPPESPAPYIDHAIRQLIERMNATGVIRTIASCQGHAMGGKEPYVYFRASVEIASAIECRLRNAAAYDDPSLHFMWMVEGMFDQNYDLAFVLYSPEQSRRSKSILNLYPIGYRNRKRLDADLLTLAWMVEDAVLMKSRDKNKPEIACGTDHHD